MKRHWRGIQRTLATCTIATGLFLTLLHLCHAMAAGDVSLAPVGMAVAAAQSADQKDDPAVILTKTVDLDGSCSGTAEIEVWPGAVVYYCYRGQNTGATTVTQHTLVDSILGVILDSYVYTLAPGATVALTRPATAEVTATNVATWTAYVSDTSSLSATGAASATVRVIPYQPAVTLAKSITTTPSTCAGASDLTVWEQTPVYYCYTVHNTGNITLTAA